MTGYMKMLEWTACAEVHGLIHRHLAILSAWQRLALSHKRNPYWSLYQALERNTLGDFS